MNPQTEQDIHLIATPFRLVGEWIKIAIFILILPVVFLISFFYWLVTGTPIMSPDECFVAQAVISVLMPVFISLVYCVYEVVRENKTQEIRTNHATLVFFLSIVPVLGTVKYLFSNGLYYNSTSTFITLLPLGVITVAAVLVGAFAFALAEDALVVKR